MRRQTLGLALLVLLAVAVPRRALAEASTDPAPIFLGLFGVLDLGLGAADLTAVAAGKRRSPEYGLFEALVGGVQAVACVEGAQDGHPLDQLRTLWWVGAGLGGVFLAHGVFTMFAPRAAAEPGPVAVAPVALSDAARGPAPGLAVLGRF